MVTEIDEFRDADLLWSQTGVNVDSRKVRDIDMIFKRIADSLTTLHERVGDELGQQRFVLDVKCAGRKRVQPYNGRHYFGRRIERRLVDVEQGFNIQMASEHDAESAIGLAAGAGCHAVDNFLLQHEMHIENSVAIVKQVK